MECVAVLKLLPGAVETLTIDRQVHRRPAETPNLYSTARLRRNKVPRVDPKILARRYWRREVPVNPRSQSYNSDTVALARRRLIVSETYRKRIGNVSETYRKRPGDDKRIV